MHGVDIPNSMSAPAEPPPKPSLPSALFEQPIVEMEASEEHLQPTRPPPVVRPPLLASRAAQRTSMQHMEVSVVPVAAQPKSRRHSEDATNNVSDV